MTSVRVGLVGFLCLLPTFAAAGVPTSRAPEPETLSLIAIAVVALIIARARKRK